MIVNFIVTIALNCLELSKSSNDYLYVVKSISYITNWQYLIRSYVNYRTKKYTKIPDKSACSGNCSFYRIPEADNNYFKIRAVDIPNWYISCEILKQSLFLVLYFYQVHFYVI